VTIVLAGAPVFLPLVGGVLALLLVAATLTPTVWGMRRGRAMVRRMRPAVAARSAP